MRYVALYPFYVVCVAGVLFRGVAQTSGKAARLNGEKLVLTLDTDLIHSRAHLSNSAHELKTKFRACSAFVCAPKKKRQLSRLHKLFDAPHRSAIVFRQGLVLSAKHSSNR